MSVSRELVLEAVADQLGIEVTDDEIREELRAAGETDEDIEEFVAAGGADRVRDDIRLKKALDRIAAEVKPIAPELHEARESDLDAGEGCNRPSHRNCGPPAARSRANEPAESQWSLSRRRAASAPSTSIRACSPSASSSSGRPSTIRSRT